MPVDLRNGQNKEFTNRVVIELKNRTDVREQVKISRLLLIWL